jgi:cbb3-type cytochrome oxidase subunit 3
MASDFFSQNPLMAGPQIAMVIFLAVFLGVTWRLLRSSKERWEHAARLPLDDGKREISHE